MEFKIGDRVRILAGNKGEYKEGLVVHIMDSNSIGVDCDEYINGHDCNGRCQRGYGTGWYYYSRSLELLKYSIDIDTLILLL